MNDQTTTVNTSPPARWAAAGKLAALAAGAREVRAPYERNRPHGAG
jgi:hypothetical protein